MEFVIEEKGQWEKFNWNYFINEYLIAIHFVPDCSE